MTDERFEELFQGTSNFAARYIPDYAKLYRTGRALQDRGYRIVLTSGSFDILHEGHSRYLEAARDHGDFLVVGVDSDERVRLRKGDGRPAVPELERLRMITHQRGVGIVTLKQAKDAKWLLIRTVRPDVLIVTADMYPQGWPDELLDYCGKVVTLPRMATVSTSARLRRIQLGQEA